MTTYLVTGAAGFIGAALARRLITEGHAVVTIDNLSTGRKENIPTGVKLIEGDCQNEKVIDRLKGEKFKAIFHIAGQSSGEISFDNPVYDLQTNTQSTLLLLKLALEIGCKQFVYASTMSVYGVQADESIKETSICAPTSFYGVGKLASEHYIRLYEQYGMQGIALRLFNVYGPGQNMENLRQGMVSIYLALALKNKHILVKGDQNRFRDFVYIDDVVEAFIAAESSRLSGIFNVGTGVRTTVQDLIQMIQAGLNFPVTVEYLGNTPGDLRGIRADLSQTQSILKWQPSTSLAHGIPQMISWAQSIGKP